MVGTIAIGVAYLAITALIALPAARIFIWRMPIVSIAQPYSVIASAVTALDA